jgi:tape measure domain-containing protein
MSVLKFDVLWNSAAAERGMKAMAAQADKLHGSFGKLNQAAGKSLSSGITSLGGTVAKFGKAGAIAFGAAGVAAAGFGLKIASGNEQAKISFTTMLGSAKRADKFLRQLQQFAAKTPFEFPELQTAASSLISVGIKADKVIPIMTSLGNATSGMGTGAEGVKRATVALQQMTAAGKITAEDLNQLRDAGIPVFDLLTKATGKTTAQIAKMAANGKLGKKELTQLMSALESGKGLERFAGLMDKQSHSLAGLASTFKDVAGQAFAGLATSAFPLIKSGLADMSTGLGHLSAWVKDNKGALGSVFKVIGSTLKTLGGTVGVVFKSFAQSAGLGKGSFKDFADFLATHQEDITKAIITGGKAFISFGTIVAKVTSGGIRLFGGFADFIGESVSFIIDRWAEMSHGFAFAFGQGPMGKGIRDADARFQAFANHARTNTHKVGDAARSMADGIDKNVIPALEKAGKGLDAYGKKSISAAHARDVVSKAEVNHRRALDASTAAAKTNGKTIDRNTEAGFANRVALGKLISTSQTYIQKLVTTNASSKRVTAATVSARAEFVRVARAMGVSRDRAQELANRYFKIPTKRATVVSQPGMTRSLRDANAYDLRIRHIKPKVPTSVLVRFGSSGSVQLNVGGHKYIANATGGVLPGFTPGRDVHQFQSLSPGVPNLKLSGGEAIMVPQWTRAVGGPKRVAQMNEDAKRGKAVGFADGGTIPSMRPATYAPQVAEQAGKEVARQAAKAVAAAAMKALRSKAAAAAAASSASGYSGPLPGGRGAAGIRAIARALGASYIAHHIDPQGGNAYDLGSSGARNTRIGNALVSAHGRLGLRYVIRQMQIASARSGWNWRRYSPITGAGDFRHVNHVHVSYANGTNSARRGIALVGENGPELVRFRGGERVTPLARSSSRGSGVTYNVTINAPNYIGSRSELQQSLVTMARNGDLNVVLDRAGIKR